MECKDCTELEGLLRQAKKMRIEDSKGWQLDYNELKNQLTTITEERDRLREAAMKVSTEYDRLFYKHYMVEEMTELKAALTKKEQ